MDVIGRKDQVAFSSGLGISEDVSFIDFDHHDTSQQQTWSISQYHHHLHLHQLPVMQADPLQHQLPTTTHVGYCMHLTGGVQDQPVSTKSLRLPQACDTSTQSSETVTESHQHVPNTDCYEVIATSQVPLFLPAHESERSPSTCHNKDNSRKSLTLNSNSKKSKNMSPATINNVKGKKRERNPETWKKNVKKRMRQTGQAYTTSKGKEVPARKVHEGCGSSCRLHCHDSLDKEKREDLFNIFWRLEDKRQQRQFIARHVTKCDIARKRVKDSDRRGFTLKYHLYDGKGLAQVCRKFFVDTLDIGRDFIYGTLDKEDPKTGLVAPERQGRHGNQKRVPESVVQSVREHIASFLTVEGTRVCKKKAKMCHLGADMSVAKMYRHYKEQCLVKDFKQVASADRYRRIYYSEFKGM